MRARVRQSQRIATVCMFLGLGVAPVAADVRPNLCKSVCAKPGSSSNCVSNCYACHTAAGVFKCDGANWAKHCQRTATTVICKP